MKKIYILLAIILFSFNFLVAQYAYQQTLYGNVPQAKYTNTGIMPEYKGYFSIPLLSGYGLTASNSGFAFNDLFEDGNISPESFLNALKDKNLLKVGNSLDIIAFGFKVGKNFISLNVSPKTDLNLGYNKSVFDFLLNGNAAYIGKSISLDGFSMDASAYIETGLGYTSEVNDKLSVGVRVKLLSGLGNVKADFNGVSLFTDSVDYSLTATSNFSINAYGTFFGNDEIAESMGNPSYFNPKNLGMGIDFGASYQFSEKLNFFGNIVDFGFLKWSEYGETLYNDGVPFKFEGLPVDELIGSDNNTDLVGDLMDTLDATFNLKRSQLSYTTALKTKLFAGASYDLNNFITFQGMLHGRVYNKRVYPMYMFAGGVNLKKWLTAKLTYNGTNKTYDNIGAGLVLNAGALQFYAMVDNIHGLTQVDYTRNLAGSFGFNIVFREKDDKKVNKAKGKNSKAENKKEKAESKKKKAEKKKEKAKEDKEKAEKKKEKVEESKEKAAKKKERAEDSNSKTTNKNENANQVKARQKSLKAAARDIKKEEKELKKEIKSEKEKEKELKSEAKEIKEEVKELKKETKEVKAKEKELKSIAKQSNTDPKEVKKELKVVKEQEKQLKSAVKEEKSEAKEIKKEIKVAKEKEKELKSEVKEQKSEVKQINKEIKDLKVNGSGLNSEVKDDNEKSKVLENNNKEINYESTSEIPYSEIIKKDSIVKINSNDINFFKDSVPAMVIDSLEIIDSLNLEPKGGGL